MELTLAKKMALYSYWCSHPGHSLGIQNTFEILGGDWKEFEDYIKMRDDFNWNSKAKDICDKDFFSIQGDTIVWQGYFYNTEGWRELTYSGFETTIHDFIHKYNRNPVDAYEAEGTNCTQYIGEIEDDEIENVVGSWLFGTTTSVVPIKTSDIVEGMPDGDYIFVDKPWEENENKK